MPTIDISATGLSRGRRKAVAVALTRWLADRGVRPQNVIVTFHDLGPGATFSGGVPLDVLADGEPRPGYVLAVCGLGPGRDEGFRRGLAEHLTAELRAADPVPFVYIEFRTTAPEQVYLARDGALGRADVS